MAEFGLAARIFQAASVITYYLTFFTGSIFVLGALIFYGLHCCCGLLWPLALVYVTWMLCLDLGTFNSGGRRVECIRRNPFFRYMRDYFPVRLVKTAELDPQKNYIFGYHPHGMISDGLAVSFGSEALQFSEKFPGIVPHIGVHSFMGWSPIFRDIVMAVGAVDVSKESCKFVLTRKGPGHSIAIVIGGSPEVLDAEPNSYILNLKSRKGFVKLALETGSPLVPVFGFGQNDLFHQPRIECLRSYKSDRSKWEKWGKVFAKGFFLLPFSRFGMMPHAQPITVVVGLPIPVEKVEIPSERQISDLHSKYVEKLKELFKEHREACGVPNDTELTIQ